MASSHREHPQDKTVLSCPVMSASAVWTGLETSQYCLWLKISKQFCPVSKCSVNWVSSCPDPVSMVTVPIVTPFGNQFTNAFTPRIRQNCSVSNILKTVCDCRKLSSHRRQDKTRQSVFAVWTNHKNMSICGRHGCLESCTDTFFLHNFSLSLHHASAQLFELCSYSAYRVPKHTSRHSPSYHF